MKMKTIAATLLATLSLASASAMAATTTTAIIGTPTIYTDTDLSSSVSFNGFDTRLGTLTGVSIAISALVDGKVTVENFSGSTKSGFVALEVLLGFGSGTTAQTFYSGNLYHQTYSLADGASVDLGQVGTIAASKNFSSGLNYFTTSTVNGTTGVKAVSSTTGGENVDTWFQTQVIASGTVTYTYTAAPVPEPETYGMLLLGLGLMGAVARRKSASAKA